MNCLHASATAIRRAAAMALAIERSAGGVSRGRGDFHAWHDIDIDIDIDIDRTVAQDFGAGLARLARTAEP